ncbi:MAG TPA: CheR family methyltransferase [Gemmatimonadaceae bacterium]
MSSTESPVEFEALLDYLKRSRGFDFSGYKRASLMRRISKRLQSVGATDYGAYEDFLEVHPEEFAHLFNTVLINVTAFFRDPQAWQVLADDVLPSMIGAKSPGQGIRVWSAGCASGEEAYTIAMVLAELLGVDDFRERVKIYATDVDEDALTKARHATYSEREVQGVPPALLEKYFEHSESGYTFRKDLRRQIIFGRHDITQDAPISRIDLLISRNTLMYFNAETQARILSRFHFALVERGILFLGRAETLLAHSNTFSPVDLKRRISVKIGSPGLRDRLLMAVHNDPADPASDSDPKVRTRDAAFDAAGVAQVVVDGDGMLALANERARALFGLTSADLGRPLQDLKLSYRPVELRASLEQVQSERRKIVLPEVEWPQPSADRRWFDVQLVPLFDPAHALLGVSISFGDITAAKRLQLELEHSNQELETAYEELQSTNEELETTNEELQSTIEELETTNEELQSTNEELETMNEELQSTNEDLQTMNEELQTRSAELNQVNAFLESILMSLRGGVVVLDRELKVLIWNSQAEDQWGLRGDEVIGKHFLNLDIGLPVEQLGRPLRACLSTDAVQTTTTVDATNRRGKPITCDVTCMPLVGPRFEVRGAILIVESRDGTSLQGT